MNLQDPQINEAHKFTVTLSSKVMFWTDLVDITIKLNPPDKKEEKQSTKQSQNLPAIVSL